ERLGLLSQPLFSSWDFVPGCISYFSTRDLLAISTKIAATNSSCLNIKTLSSFRGDIVFLLQRIRIQKFLPFSIF
ncbi:hypothetical protein, partial [Streptococcus sp. HMSC062D07]|uniref:hypothetical protein n=1 Tax=Streptococcus sp. HMSC062D07 TaxID=1739461 RepID=UPI001C99FAF9